MEFKGTKGKWNLGYNTIKVNEFSKLFMPVYRTIITNNIVSVVYSENNIEQEVKANALLISKAPEMLELLQSLVSSEMTPLAIRKQAKRLIKEATEL